MSRLLSPPILLTQASKQTVPIWSVNHERRIIWSESCRQREACCAFQRPGWWRVLAVDALGWPLPEKRAMQGRTPEAIVILGQIGLSKTFCRQQRGALFSACYQTKLLKISCYVRHSSMRWNKCENFKANCLCSLSCSSQVVLLALKIMHLSLNSWWWLQLLGCTVLLANTHRLI